MKNKLKFLIFLPVFVLGANMLYLSSLTEFSKVNIAVQGYDPRDLFAGNYMYLQLDWDKTDCAQFENQVCPKENFNDTYNFYINKEYSADLEKAVVTNDVNLVFSYQKGFEPIIVDLTVDGVSYKKYIENIK